LYTKGYISNFASELPRVGNNPMARGWQFVPGHSKHTVWISRTRGLSIFNTRDKHTTSFSHKETHNFHQNLLHIARDISHTHQQSEGGDFFRKEIIYSTVENISHGSEEQFSCDASRGNHQKDLL